jgi:uncharacterized protein YceK
MQRFTRLALSTLLSLQLNACGTVLGRDKNTSDSPDFYKGAAADLRLLGVNSSGEAHGATVFCWISVVCPLLTLVSLPIDAVLDTLLLPIDALNRPAPDAQRGLEPSPAKPEAAQT